MDLTLGWSARLFAPVLVVRLSRLMLFSLSCRLFFRSGRVCPGGLSEGPLSGQASQSVSVTSGPLIVGSPGNRSCTFPCLGLCLRSGASCSRYCLLLMSVLLSVGCPVVCPAKSRTFPSWAQVFLVRSCVYKLLRFSCVTLMGGGGGSCDSSVSRSSGATPRKKAWRPIGHSTPQFSSSKMIGFCFRVCHKVLSWVCRMACSLGAHWHGCFSPSGLGPMFALMQYLLSRFSPSFFLTVLLSPLFGVFVLFCRFFWDKTQGQQASMQPVVARRADSSEEVFYARGILTTRCRICF